MSAFLVSNEHLNMIITWAIAIVKLINCWEFAPVDIKQILDCSDYI
jgi:accessory gene regulator protein AgrB